MSNRTKEGLLTVTRTFDFCYGHRLLGYEGKCSEYHGHNAHVEVEVVGRDEKSYPTMVVDFKILKGMVEKILNKLDHRDLTCFFKSNSGEVRIDGVDYNPPTAEIICSWLAEQIDEALPDGVLLIRLRVSETPNSWAEWKTPEQIDPLVLFEDPYFRQMLTDFTDRRGK